MISAGPALFLAATAIFAITGVLAAARQNMDVLSFIIIGVVTALGGGTMRDVVLGVPVFWLRDPTYLYVAAAASVVTFFFEQAFRASTRSFLYLDTTGTAIFAVLATARTQALGLPATIAVVMGVLTGVGGGVLRDLLTQQPTLLARRELFMTPILVGVGVYAFAGRFAPEHGNGQAAVAMALIAVFRGAAIRWSWAFPDWLTYRPLREPPST